MRLVHTKEVTGSIPVSPTQLSGQLRSCNRPFLILVQQQSAAVGGPAGYESGSRRPAGPLAPPPRRPGRRSRWRAAPARANAGRLARKAAARPAEPEEVKEPRRI